VSADPVGELLAAEFHPVDAESCLSVPEMTDADRAAFWRHIARSLSILRRIASGVVR
jgi:hypothetical protein